MKKLIFAFVLLLGVAGLYEVSKTTEFNNFLFKPSSISSPASSPTNGVTQTIMLTNNGFSPEIVTVKTGTKVVWSNTSGKPQNVTSDSDFTHPPYAPLNLGNVTNGSSVSVVFDKTGTYKYHNQINPMQTGTVIVQ